MTDKKQPSSGSMGSIGRGYTPPAPGSINERDWTVGTFSAKTLVPWQGATSTNENFRAAPNYLPQDLQSSASSSAHLPVVQSTSQGVAVSSGLPISNANPLTDSLTGCMAFPYFVHRLDYEAMRTRLIGGPLSVIVVSINRYRDLGIEIGAFALDASMCELAKIIGATARALDLIGVYNEGKFVIACPHTDAATAKAFCAKLAAAVVNVKLTYKWHEFGIQVSSGISEFCEEISDAESLIALADLGAETAEADQMIWHCEQDA